MMAESDSCLPPGLRSQPPETQQGCVYQEEVS